jgi:hydrogenase/urease accessory protein HupE
MRGAVVLGTLLGTAGRAFAHPGHGLDGGSFGLLHYVTEPLHLGLGLALALLATASVAVVRRRRALRLAHHDQRRRPRA